MKLSSIRYLLREGFRNIWQNRFMAIASIGVLVSCLLLTGGAYLIFVNINHAFQWVYGQNVVVVFATEDSTQAQVQALGQSIKGIDNVAKIEFLSKEESLNKLVGTIPEATFSELQGEDNPLLDSFIVTFEDLAQLKSTIPKIEKLAHVDSVSYNGDIAETLTKIRQIVLAVGGWIIGMLLLVSLFIIANTIKLTVYNRRLEIYIMKSVGATNGFIRTPFVIEGMVLGLLSGLLAYGILYFVYSKLAGMFSGGLMFGLVSFSTVWWMLLVGFLLAGMLTGMAGSAISMRKYLKDENSL